MISLTFKSKITFPKLYIYEYESLKDKYQFWMDSFPHASQDFQSKFFYSHRYYGIMLHSTDIFMVIEDIIFHHISLGPFIMFWYYHRVTRIQYSYAEKSSQPG